MVRRDWLLVAVPAWMLGCAYADPPATAPQSPMAWAFGNTLKMEIPGQGYRSRRYNPDGTWTEINTFGESRGKWSVDNGKACYVQTDPAPDPGYERLCYEPTPRKVGDKWSNIDPVTLNEVVIAVVAGRE